MNRGRRHAADMKMSEARPSIGCYVKEEFADEFQVQSGSPAKHTASLSKRSRWSLGLLLVFMTLVGVFIGAQRHLKTGDDETGFLSKVEAFGNRALALVKFPIEQVRIVGHKQTPEQVIVARLGSIWDRSLISLNTTQAQKNIEKLPWVKRAVVERVFPHGLNIYVTERKPIGRWVTMNGRFVFDQDGVIIQKIKVGRYLDLPIYEGKMAPHHAHGLQEALKKFDDLSPFFVRYKRVDGRRWTLILRDGMEVLLPEVQMMRGLSRLRALQVQHNILSRQISAIDLRLEDRVTFRPKRGQNDKVLSTLEDLETKGKLKSDSLGVPKEGI